MMKTNSIKYLLGLCVALWASALSAQTHWTVNPSDYSGHMTLYYALQEGDATLSLSDYEVAAFIGGECRGVGTVLTSGSNSYGQLFIYGLDDDEGKAVSFKYYTAASDEEKNIAQGGTVTYAVDGSVGYPSTPHVFDLANNVVLGDVNGDDKINATDVRLLINRRFNRTMPDGFIEAACDINQDGKINATDVRLIINLRFNR